MAPCWPVSAGAGSGGLGGTGGCIHGWDERQHLKQKKKTESPRGGRQEKDPMLRHQRMPAARLHSRPPCQHGLELLDWRTTSRSPRPLREQRCSHRQPCQRGESHTLLRFLRERASTEARASGGRPTGAAPAHRPTQKSCSRCRRVEAIAPLSVPPPRPPPRSLKVASVPPPHPPLPPPHRHQSAVAAAAAFILHRHSPWTLLPSLSASASA